MSETGIAQLFPKSAIAGPWFVRAFEGLTPRIVGFVGLVVVAYVLAGIVNVVIVAIVDGRLPMLFGAALKRLACYALVAAVMLCAVMPTLNLGPQQGWWRVGALALATVGGTLIAVAVRYAADPWMHPNHPPEQLPGYLTLLRFEGVTYAVLAGLLVSVAVIYRRTRTSLVAAHRADLDRITLERQVTQARLQVLQAQIEPHFLFNTLANLRRLYETDRDAGHRMLDNLMRYFAVALPQMRAGTSTLAREVALIQSYLNIQQIRLGRRLAFSIEIPEALEALDVPPMMLLTLVENALKHGIAPLPEGGTIRVVAKGSGLSLVLSVIDTGRGLTGTAGVGTGLANIRARLDAAYAGAASLSIQGNAPRGIVATITLPIAGTASLAAGMQA